MKIQLNQIPAEGFVLKAEAGASALGLGPDILELEGPVKLSARIIRITNVVSVDLELSGAFKGSCSRCLEGFSAPFSKNLQFNYPVLPTDFAIDISQDIREEIILDYPLKPLCRPDCKGLCAYCGKNLNEEKCSCQSKIKN